MFKKCAPARLIKCKNFMFVNRYQFDMGPFPILVKFGEAQYKMGKCIMNGLDV